MADLFVYGTLCYPEIVERLTGKTFISEQAILRGYQRKKVKDADYPAIIRNDVSEVKGLLLQGVDKDSLKIILFYEGNDYRCEDLLVDLMEKEIKAKVFVWNSSNAMLEDFDWNQEEFAKNFLRFYLEKVIPKTLREFTKLYT